MSNEKTQVCNTEEEFHEFIRMFSIAKNVEDGTIYHFDKFNGKPRNTAKIRKRLDILSITINGNNKNFEIEIKDVSTTNEKRIQKVVDIDSVVKFVKQHLK